MRVSQVWLFAVILTSAMIVVLSTSIYMYQRNNRNPSAGANQSLWRLIDINTMYALKVLTLQGSIHVFRYL